MKYLSVWGLILGMISIWFAVSSLKGYSNGSIDTIDSSKQYAIYKSCQKIDYYQKNIELLKQAQSMKLTKSQIDGLKQLVKTK